MIFMQTESLLLDDIQKAELGASFLSPDFIEMALAYFWIAKARPGGCNYCYSGCQYYIINNGLDGSSC